VPVDEPGSEANEGRRSEVEIFLNQWVK
jgi:hypothetical protein